MLNNSGEIVIPAGDMKLCATLAIPVQAKGIVVFVHGSGSSRLSPRNRYVAGVLQKAGLATMLMDLLDKEEAEHRGNVFNIDLLTGRVVTALEWLGRQEPTRHLPIGLFGASTGAAAALETAARRPQLVKALVSRGGRPDLVADDLSRVVAPTLLIVGEHDPAVMQHNIDASHHLKTVHRLQIVPGATHLFAEPGTLEQVASWAEQWFRRHLHGSAPRHHSEFRGFRHREDAARRLAARLKERSFVNPVVLAIPRGGVPIGAILADELHADFDVILSRKLRMPDNHECAVGAISESGQVFYLEKVSNAASLEIQAYLTGEARHQLAEIAERRRLFRQGRPPIEVAGRSVIVTDDGIATGSTMIASLRTLRAQKPLELVVAVPVAADDRLREVGTHCEEAICLLIAPELIAVSQYYQDFRQVSDEEVISLLQQNPCHPLGERGRL